MLGKEILPLLQKALIDSWNEIMRKAMVVGGERTEDADAELKKVLKDYIPAVFLEVPAIWEAFKRLIEAVKEVDSHSFAGSQWTPLEAPPQDLEVMERAFDEFPALREYAIDGKRLAEIAKRFKLDTAAVIRHRPKETGGEPRYFLGASPSFVYSLPYSIFANSLLLLQAIFYALERKGNDILKELKECGAPNELIDWVQREWKIYQREGLGNLFFRLVIPSERHVRANSFRNAQQIVGNLVNLLRYSGTLLDVVDSVRRACFPSEEKLLARAQHPEFEEGTRELIEIRNEVLSALSRIVPHIVASPSQLRSLAYSLLQDAMDGWLGIAYHEALHILGKHPVPETCIEEIRYINRYAAEHLIRLASDKGAKELELGDAKINLTPDMSPAELENILNSVAERALRGDKNVKGLSSVFNRALNIYYDLVINNLVFRYVHQKSPLALLGFVNFAIFPHTFGLPLFEELPEDASLDRVIAVHSKYRNAVGKELAEVLYSPVEGGGGGGNGGNGGNGGKGGNGRGKKKQKGGEGRGGRGRRLWDWGDDDVKEKDEEEEEKEKEERGREEEEKEKEKEEGEKDEEGHKGLTEEEAKKLAEQLKRDLGDSLRRQWGSSLAGHIISSLSETVVEFREFPPPTWDDVLTSALSVLFGQASTVYPGETYRGPYRPRRGVGGGGEAETRGGGIPEYYVRPKTKKKEIYIFILLDVSGSMHHLYDATVSEIVGWLASQNWVHGGQMQIGLEKGQVHIISIPIDTVIHRVAWLMKPSTDTVADFVYKALKGVQGFHTDIYGVGAGNVGFIQLVNLLLSPEYREEIRQGEVALDVVKEPEAAYVEFERGTWSVRHLLYALEEMGLIGEIIQTMNESTWIFVIATDHGTDLPSDEVMANLKTLLNAQLGGRYAVIYLLYTTETRFKEIVEDLKHMWTGANGVQLGMLQMAQEGIVEPIAPGVYAFFIDENERTGSIHELGQARLLGMQLESIPRPSAREKTSEEETSEPQKPKEVSEPVKPQETPEEEQVEVVQEPEKAKDAEVSSLEEGEKQTPTEEESISEQKDKGVVEEGEEESEKKEEEVKQRLKKAFYAALFTFIKEKGE